MKRFSVLFSAAILGFASLTASAELERRSLNGLWDFSFTAGQALPSARADFTATDKIVVPGCFDLMPKWYAKRGLAHYRRTIELEKSVANAFLVVQGMGLQARFFLDGREIKTVKLPYVTFEVELGPLAAGRHELVCALDNTLAWVPENVYKPNYDFFLSGGFYHGVDIKLQEKPVELDRVVVRTRDYATGTVELTLEAKGELPSSLTAKVAFDGLAPQEVRFEKHRAKLTVPAFKLWSPDEPNLHRVSVACAPYGAVSTRFGIRELKTQGKGFLLNGKPLWLKGVNRHETHPDDGYATSRITMYRDIMLMKSIGCNYVRGAHYPQCDEFLSLCDEMGLMVWEESLGWGNFVDLDNPEFIASQIEQTQMMVRNSINHPSVVISAFLNECGAGSELCRSLVNRLIEAIRAEDSGHLISFSAISPTENISGANVDFHAFNCYPAWHGWVGTATTPESLAAIIKKVFELQVGALRTRYGHDKPVIITETGCYSIYGEHDPMGAQWSEEFQSEYLEHWMRLVFDSPEMAGFTVWQFCDSRTYFRGGSDIRTKPLSYNMAGLFDRYRKPKLASTTVKKYYTEKRK